MNFSENEIIWTLVRSHREECYGLNHMAKQVMNLFSMQFKILPNAWKQVFIFTMS